MGKKNGAGSSGAAFNWSKLLSLLVAIGVHGTLWYSFNIYFGNLALLNVLSWVSIFPVALRHVLAMMPSAGQFFYEEKMEEQDAKAKLLKEGKITQEEYDACKMDGWTLAFIGLCSTVLDLLCPAMGIVISVQRAGGQIGLTWAVGVALITSWGCQRFLRKALKEALPMLWQVVKMGWWNLTHREKKAGKVKREKHAAPDSAPVAPVYEETWSPIQLTLGDRQ